jgi:uncharacterized protein (DUF433 family)
MNKKLISRNPEICFGRFRITGTGISVTVVAERNKAGDSICSLAEEYSLPESHIRAAVQWTKRRSQAAKKGWRTRRGSK